MSGSLKFPFGVPDIQTPVFAATLNQKITDLLTIIQVTVTAAITDLSLTAATQLVDGSKLPIGAKVIIDITQDATGRAVAFGSTGDTITSLDLVGVANDRDSIELTWTGTEFVGGAWDKVVDAA